MLVNQQLSVKGGPWKDICHLNIKEQRIKDKMLTGLAMEVGNGRSTLFWEDNWLQGGPLKVAFPRLFSISNKQGSIIGDCGFLDGLEWIWNFQWRRELFEWELELVHQLHERLRPVKLLDGKDDNMVWKFDSKGVFSTKVVVRVLQSETLSDEITSYSFTSSVWRGVKEIESVEHLFLLCELTWQVWCSWLRSFGEVWPIPGTIRELFERWTGRHKQKQDQKKWLPGFFAVIWNIWVERNARIFQNQETGVEFVIRKTMPSYNEWTESDPFGG
ncbi:uncharacterized protein LOC107464717 [Arachis duranensis]|uniref:Uncharacterized protein LOC107464717 n=1 Tax=Arachis duranensis TaxID=130453 RepID=A0A6P4BAM9_ARADU|nr:uncharacterized protein LOC107464717 [Arachis duranensis]